MTEQDNHILILQKEKKTYLESMSQQKNTICLPSSIKFSLIISLYNMCCLHFVSDKKIIKIFAKFDKIKISLVIYFYQYLTNNQDQLFFAVVDDIQIRFIIKRHIWQFKDNFRRIKK